jgi:hypothetical protein
MSITQTASFLVGLLCGILLVGAAIRLRHRIVGRRSLRRGLSEEMIRQIETHGRIEMDEPLDREHIAREEERFWEETWDEPEEY